MANRITYEARSDLPDMRMSNGLTSVFIEVLALAGSSLALTAREHDLVAWIASRDQAVLGVGAAGFDMAEIPWNTEDFAADRIFLFRMIEAAKSKRDWAKLEYGPKEDWLIPRLGQFLTLLSEFQPEHIHNGGSTVAKISSSVTDFERCQIHGIIKHAYGCPICNRQ